MIGLEATTGLEVMIGTELTIEAGAMNGAGALTGAMIEVSDCERGMMSKQLIRLHGVMYKRASMDV